jgi:hypothetical protein
MTDQWEDAREAMPEIAEEVEGLRTLDPVHGSRDLLDRHGREAVLKMWRKLHDGELKASDERDEARAEVERLRKVVDAALVWAGDKVVGDPDADRRLAAVLVEHENSAGRADTDANGSPMWNGLGDK